MTNCITDRVSLTDEQIDEAFASVGFSIAVGYGDEDKVAITDESLDDFVSAREGYANAGAARRLSARVGGATYPALLVERCQVARGQPRRDLVVIDFGDVRAAYAS